MIQAFKSVGLILVAFTMMQLTSCSQEQSKSPESVPYNWKNVQMVGGGFVTGIVFHPTAPGVCYCRTDMGGAYRRNPETLRWEPMLDWMSIDDYNLMGIESISLDPNDPDRLYMACGTYTNERTPDGAILWSTDRGHTFHTVKVPFKMGGNEDGRGNGERMAVDPNNSSILYLGTRKAGLWKSTDYGQSWAKVDAFPDITPKPPAGMKDADSIRRWQRFNQGSGIVFVVFDPKRGSAGKGSSTLYVGVSLMNQHNLFRSTDFGKTWEPVPGEPNANRPTHGILASNGMFYLTYGNMPGPSRMTDGSVWKFDTKNGKWTDITPDKPDPAHNRGFGYAAVSVDAQNPQTAIVSSYHRYGIDSGDDIFRTLDGGETWTKIFGSGAVRDDSLAPYTSHTGRHWLFDIEIDPNNPDHALFTTGYGGHETFNLTDLDKGKTVVWHIMGTGIEETVALDLLSPPEGAHLITAIGDYGGFVHWNLDKPEPEGNFSNPRFGNTNSLDCAWEDPSLIVRVGNATSDNPGKTIGYSTDFGKSWQPCDTIPDPESRSGHIAVSADGDSWVWAPDPVRHGWGPNSEVRLIPVYYTKDRGATWNECEGLPANTRVIADRNDSQIFYAMDLFAGKLFISTDGAVTFKEQTLTLPNGLPSNKEYRGDSRGGQDQLYSTPGEKGDIWLAAYDGLYNSTDMGKTFVKTDHIQRLHGFGFGKSAPGKKDPALYMIGVVDSNWGVFRSDDLAKNWTRINDDQHQWGLLLHVTGDPKQYGRVYVGTHGRGTIYGDPANTEN